jgi:hypothetical protein
MSKPRAATSVATNISLVPDLNFWSAPSLEDMLQDVSFEVGVLERKGRTALPQLAVKGYGSKV